MLNVIAVISVSLATVLVGALIFGKRRWESETRKLRARLDAARRPVRPKTVDFNELQSLPAPVQRFFRMAVKEGQPMVAAVQVRHHGTFNMGEAVDQWKAFTSDQMIVAQRPGFDWDGRIALMPGVAARVHDAYIAGEGLIHASLVGCFTLADVRGVLAVAEGELMRFLAEASWYPTVLLPSQGVRWQSVDDRSALATVTDDGISATLRFTFGESGLIETVRAEARGRMVKGEMVPTAWEGRFWNYGERGGMRIPMDGEVAWLLPEGAKAYWRGKIMEITYRFAE